ncbi:hypothetical protein [Pseudomonas sp.]|uniref:hypothetical protein n=1 Tax=Pseudomonas sp. TaxID=306 RepID=UPI003C4F98A1
MIEEKRYITMLIGLLRDGRTSEERAAAARGLGFTGSEEAVEALSLTIANGRTAEERAAAAESLGQALANRR